MANRDHARKDDRTPEEKKEEALRPSRFLGHDRAALAVYLIERGAYDIAERQLRRAIWLNPEQAAFKESLAYCLYKKGDLAGAREWAQRALADEPARPSARKLLEWIDLKAE